MDSVEKLQQLKQLLDEGIISKEEFEDRKARILFPEDMKEEQKAEEESAAEKIKIEQSLDEAPNTKQITIKRKCPKCGAVVDSKFCTSCGQDLTGPDIVKICPNCGTETTAKFCTGCGTKLIDDAVGAVKAGVSTTNIPSNTAGNESNISASELVQKAKKLGAQKVKDIEKNAETKRALKEKEAELLRIKQEKEAELIREKQEREVEQLRIQQRMKAEESARQIEEERKKAREKEEQEKKRKRIEQKRINEEALTYLETAAKTEDHGVAAGFYRKAEELFSSIPEVDGAEERSLFSARKAKEQEVFIEAERIKAEQAAKAEALAARAAKEVTVAEESQNTLYQDVVNDGGREESVTPLDRVAKEQDVNGNSSETETQARKAPNKSKIIIAIAAVAALAIAGVIFGLSHTGTEDTATSDQVASEDISDAESEAVATPEFEEANILTLEEVDLFNDDSLGDKQKVAAYRITNTGKEDVWYFDVNYQFLDKDGNQLCEDGRYHQGRLSPGKNTLMYAFTEEDVDVDEISTVNVKSYSYRIGPNNYDIDLQVKSVDVYEEDQEWYSNVDFDEADILNLELKDKGLDSEGDYQTQIVVTNEGSDSLKEVNVDMEYYDKDGNPVDTDGRYSDSVLGPQKSVTIDSFCIEYYLNDPKEVDSYASTGYQYYLTKKDSRGYNKYTVNLLTKTAYGEYEDY